MTSSAGARIAFFLSADSFEGFYGGIFGLDRENFLATYRNDFVWEYANGLRARGHHVVLYILSYGKAELRTLEGGLQVRFVLLPSWLRLVDPLTYRLRHFAGFRTLRDRVAYGAYGLGFEQALVDDEIDVIYHQEIWTPRFDIVVARAKVPVVGAEHGAVYEAWMDSDKKISFPKARWLTCQSVDAVERVRRMGGSAELLYNAVDTGFFEPPAAHKTRTKTILTIGRLVEEQKRFTDLLRTMQLLPEFILLVVGSGPDEEKLKQLTAELGVEERVRFLGFISDRSELRKLYQESGVFVSSSAWEAVALVVLEAMSCEMPVVCTSIPSFKELLRNEVDGVLVPVGDPERISNAVRLASERTDLLGGNARKTVISRYSAVHLYARLSALLHK